MDAITYLRHEHSKVRNALAAISKISNEKIRLNKFNALCKDLARHEAMEEKVWYPVLRKDPDMRDIIKHLIAEEKSAAKAISVIKKTEYGVIWRLRFYKFKNDVEHHAKSEEKELFPKARKYLTKAEAMALGTKMQKFKASRK